jgi:hypothetical protein
MKKLFSSLLALTIFFSLALGQEVVSGENTQKRNIGSFHAVKTSAGIQVILTKGSKEELAVTASDADLVDKIKTVVSNGVLRISRENDNWRFWEKRRNWKVVVYVSYTQLDGLEASSGGSIQAKSVNLDKLTADVSSGGTITLSGSANALSIDGSSGGIFRGYDLAVTNCKADVSSGAGVQVTVNKEISAEASSGGYVRFKGDGLIRNINVSSGGSVKRQSDK